MQQISLDEITRPRLHYREVVIVVKCLFWLAVLTYGEPNIIEAVVGWIGRMGQ